MKHNFKIRKIAAVLMALALTASLTACGGTTSQADGKVTVGVIQFTSHPSLDNCYEGIVKGLNAAGYTDSNMVLDHQNAQADTAACTQLAQNMIAKKYDVIIAIATPAAASAYAATQAAGVPLVFSAVSDPVAAKLVNSLDAPGGNCTGTSDLLNLDGQLKMIRAFQPTAKKIGVLYTTSEANSISHLKEFKSLAGNYGFEVVESGVQTGAEVAQAATSLAGKVDCINNFTDNNVVDNLGAVLSATNNVRIPVYGSEIAQVEKGCLASESLDYVELGKETGSIAARVLKGESAASIPVSQIKDSFPVCNTDVATALNIALPADYATIQKITTAA